MEVAVRMESIGKDAPEETVLIGKVYQFKTKSLISDVYLGRFAMVCRDAFTHGAKAVNPVITSTPEERALYSLGEGVP
jgi:acyl-coenzyme A thioesterase 9